MRFAVRDLGCVTALLICTGALGMAQEYRGRVQGVVADPSGAVIPGVTLVLKNDGTNVEVSKVSNGEGRYLFDYVDPGTYTLTADMRGFKRLIQRNVLVQQRGDVTADLKMETGAVNESITITDSPVAIQFNTASRDLTIESKLVRELPTATRNPFQLALLDPTIVNRGSTIETQPYHHRTANEMDLGGGTKYRNDILLDGTPLIAGNKLGYTPPMDAVTEYTVLQNSVDAEFGHSAGGIGVITMKSGTNQFHGSAYYYGRNAGLNALTDRALRRHTETPNWTTGGSLGMPIIKNKLFVFGVYEKIENGQASPGTYTLPTAAERLGDFSQSLTTAKALRVIYDPASTVGANRTPFAGNIIPVNRQDPVSRKLIANLWNPNGAGDDATLLNNFKYLNELNFHYYNYSIRSDYYVSDKLKIFGRISRLKTDQDQDDFTDGKDPLKMRNVTGSKRNGWNIAGDGVYTLNPTTVLNIRGAFYKVEDKRDYPALAVTEADYSSIWPNAWWKSGDTNYMAGRPLIYFPHIQVDATSYGNFGVQNFWYQQPDGYSLSGRLTKYLNKHALKVGAEARFKRGNAARFYFGDFRFTSQETGRDFTRADAVTGTPWASFVLGSLNPSGANVRYNVLQNANTEMYGVYFQDDYKISRNVTLNLGLRYEYEGGLWDPLNRLPQTLDLTDPIPGMKDAVDPLMPADVKAKMAESAGAKNFTYNGAFHFTEDGNSHKTVPWKLGFMPRVGVAWRLGDRTVLRAGYGRFVVPASLANTERDDLGEIDLGGFTPTTVVPPVLAGIPQSYLSTPFPLGLDPIVGKKFGRNTNLGSAVSVDEYQQRTPISDRFNLSFQRQLPGKFIIDVTYYTNFVSHDQYSLNLNMSDPRLSYKYGSALTQTVNNPFFNFGTPDTFPGGTLRNARTVSVGSLLVPYPQYGAITQTGTDLRSARYQSFQFRGQRAFDHGLSFLATYAYTKTRSQWFFDPQDEYDRKLTDYDFTVTQSGGSGNPSVAADSKHRFVTAINWEIPVGRGHMLGSNFNPVVDHILGGWQAGGIYTYTSGAPLIFSANIVAPASVKQLSQQGAGSLWFDTTGFAVAPSFTRRANPWYYDGLVSPNFRNLDFSLAKRVPIKERFNVQLRLEAFNALNGMNWASPNLTVNASDFARTNTQLSGYYGRQIQYSARLTF